MLTSNETSKGNTGGYLSVTQNNDFYSWVNKSCVDKFVQWYNNGSNGHLFYVGVDLMMRRSMLPIHDDVIKWKHFPRYWPFVRGIHRSPVNSPHKGQWRGALMFSLICARINGWVNNREAGDLRCHPTHCDVIVMYYASLWGFAYCVALSAVLNFDCLGDCSPFTSVY